MRSSPNWMVRWNVKEACTTEIANANKISAQNAQERESTSDTKSRIRQEDNIQLATPTTLKLVLSEMSESEVESTPSTVCYEGYNIT